MDQGEVDLLDDTIAAMVTRHDGQALTAALDEFGWTELLEGSPEIAVPSLFGAQGRYGAGSGALHDVMGAGLGQLSSDMHPSNATVLLPVPRAAATGHRHADTVSIKALSIQARPGTPWLVVAASGPGGAGSVLRVEAALAQAAQKHGLDGGLHVEGVQGEIEVTAADVLAEGNDAVGWWAEAEAAGRRALCHEIAGACAAMLDLALAHARERAQFGRLIGTFQAVRHKLAEAYVAVAAAEAAADAAWDSDDDWLASTTAKLVASRSCTTTVAHTQQVLAGIGFTAEHAFHRLMKRAIVLDRLLGTATDLAPLVGRHLASRGSAPRLVEL